MPDVTQRKETAYRYLIDAARMLNSAVGVEELVWQILSSSRDVMQCRACSVCLPDSATGDLIIHGTQPELKKQILRVPAGKGIAGRVFRTRRSENILNAQADSDHYGGIATATKLPAQAMLTIPLEDGAFCHGVMQALNPIDRESFDALDEEVFGAFGSLIATTLTRMQVQEVATRKELEEIYRNAELAVARKAQVSFMPPPTFETKGLRLRVFQKQAADIGGDFYSYHELNENALLVAVGDASGKGIPAALESARVCTLIGLKASGCSADRLPEWLAEINNVLQESAERAGSLTTIAILFIDRKRRLLYAACFGQFRPRYLSLENRWEELICPLHPPLGVFATHRFAVTQVPLGIGRQWLLLTDGFVEARSESGDQFGENALDRALAGSAANDSDPLDELENRWREFSQLGPDPDDATALLLTDVVPPIERLIEANLNPETIPTVRTFCESWISFAGFVGEEEYQILLACDEILTNVHKHAYDTVPGPVRGEAVIDYFALTFIITHWGVGLDADESIPKSNEPTRSGGYGLPFIRKVFDKVQFERAEDYSTITLSKRIVDNPAGTAS
jgi:sigma-B regulation protein RsbU (phosphoserine phosphatase)